MDKIAVGVLVFLVLFTAKKPEDKRRSAPVPPPVVSPIRDIGHSATAPITSDLPEIHNPRVGESVIPAPANTLPVPVVQQPKPVVQSQCHWVWTRKGWVYTCR